MTDRPKKQHLRSRDFRQQHPRRGIALHETLPVPMRIKPPLPTRLLRPNLPIAPANRPVIKPAACVRRILFPGPLLESDFHGSKPIPEHTQGFLHDLRKGPTHIFEQRTPQPRRLLFSSRRLIGRIDGHWHTTEQHRNQQETRPNNRLRILHLAIDKRRPVEIELRLQPLIIDAARELTQPRDAKLDKGIRGQARGSVHGRLRCQLRVPDARERLEAPGRGRRWEVTASFCHGVSILEQDSLRKA